MSSIVFICIGNACRSQIAEGFAKHFGRDDLEVYSAGTSPLGHLSQGTTEVMKERGIDISHHYSKGVADLPFNEFDYVITMGCGDFCPGITAKKKRIDWQIPDPYGGGPEAFRSVRNLVEKKVKNLISQIPISK